jgi:hypothetical protein
MSAPSAICLKFSSEITEPVRSRISYAFRVFAAIYNHRVAEAELNPEAICCIYGKTLPNARGSRSFHIPALYRPRSLGSGTATLAKRRYGNEDIFLAHGIDKATGNPDWLGEIFEWISCSHELGVTSRDYVGRIPDSDMIFGRLGISPRKPYATLLMSWMENSLRNGNAAETLPKAPSPVPSAAHIVVCSHDIDFHHVSRMPTLVRLIKNLGISCTRSGSWSFFSANSTMILKMLTGKRVGDYLPPLLEAIEKCEFRSTLFAVTRRGHRRDPNYRIQDIAPHLREAARKGFSVDLHGSYTSITEAGTLTPESRDLENMMGKKPLGSRQHWLRFDHHEKLFQAVERAELVFDSTLGFSKTVGFRNGASFAFPPYDFSKERPHKFLEIPLVLMDVSLEDASRSLRVDAQEIAEEVLRESRKWSWGGVAVLWHNPIEPLEVPDEINHVFWNCANQRHQFAEKWMSATEFLTHCIARYQNAGLLEDVRINA